MKIESIPERERQYGTLVEYFAGRADGDELLWEQIANETKIPMDATGRALVRRALRKVKRPYEAVRGEGVRLSSSDNTMKIMGGKFVRIDNAVRRADRTRAELSTRHLDQLPRRQKEQMLVLAGFFGTVRAFAKEASAKVLGTGTNDDAGKGASG